MEKQSLLGICSVRKWNVQAMFQVVLVRSVFDAQILDYENYRDAKEKQSYSLY